MCVCVRLAMLRFIYIYACSSDDLFKMNFRDTVCLPMTSR